ncbi:MAG: EamA family transporter [Gammaproteobacteria bacterium]|nr:EamA family transporter [Gammaproteobacteria bacterium]
MQRTQQAAPAAAGLILAFAAVYLIWGSTYLAIRIGVADLPPFLLAGWRFVIAALLMAGWAVARGERRWPDARAWRRIGVTGVLMLVGGNGLVTYAETGVASNQAALVVASSALWMAWFGTFGVRGERLHAITITGLLLGLGGVALLVGAGLRLQSAAWPDYAALLAAPVLWALGSVHGRRYPPGCGSTSTAAGQMLVAGVVLLVIGGALGESSRWRATPAAFGALAYLIVFGSCIAYGAYQWLVGHATPAQLGTYAYVNPAIAALLGWWWLGESLGRMQILGTLLILGSVALIGWGHRRPRD